MNYGPGAPLLAHKVDERVRASEIPEAEERLRAWLTS